MKIREMTGSGEINLLLTNAVEKMGRNGNTFLTLTLTDGETEINGNMFNSKSQDVNGLIERVVKCYMSVGTYNGNPSYTIQSVEATDEDAGKYVRSAPGDREKMFSEIIDILRKTGGTVKPGDGTVCDIAINILIKNKDKFVYWSAAKSVHHNIYGGLLYHTYRMVKSAEKICDVYPLNKRVLISATALHDIGKLYELETTKIGSATYSVSGQLFGHAYMGMNLVNQEANIMKKDGFSFDKTELQAVLHCIAAHHGKLEWGAIVTPAIPEATALHTIDLLDSRMFIFEEEYKKLDPGTASPSYTMGIDGYAVNLGITPAEI